MIDKETEKKIVIQCKTEHLSQVFFELKSFVEKKLSK